MKKELLKVLSHEMITRSETRNILIGIANREYPDTQVAALLATLALRGTTVDELLGFRDGMMETGNRVTLNNPRYIDIVGTGGDCKNTFNISTASCFVVAGAGYKVAKHGNYSATSVSGASNVMENHGITFTADNELLQRSIDQSGVAYLHARLFANAEAVLADQFIAMPLFYTESYFAMAKDVTGIQASADGTELFFATARRIN